MKSRKMMKRIGATVLSVALAATTLAGCQKTGAQQGAEESMREEKPESTLGEIQGQTEEKELGVTEESVQEESLEIETVYLPSEEVRKNILERCQKVDTQILNEQRIVSTVRMEVENSFLETMQAYYMATDDYTTEEPTIGGLITSSVADRLSGGSSTVSAAIISAADSIKEGDSPGELVTEAFSAAMAELPQEIATKVFEYLVGETILKGIKIIKALIPENKQTQHLANLIDRDLQNEIRELSLICSKQDLTVEDCYRGVALSDSILQKTHEIEIILGVNAGSNAWRPFYRDGGNYIATDLNELAFAIKEQEACKKELEILKSLDENKIKPVTKSEFEDYNRKIQIIWVEEISGLSFAEDAENNIKSMYDLEEAAIQSHSTNLTNTIGQLLGNPLSDIYVLKKNQEAEVLTDALAQFNSQAISIWRDTYFPLKIKLVELNDTLALFEPFVNYENESETDRSVRMAALQKTWGEDGSLSGIKEELASLTGDLNEVVHLTEIMLDTYSVALTASENNRIFLQDYEFALNEFKDAKALCNEAVESDEYGEISRRSTSYESENCRKMAQAAVDMIQVYAENVDKRSDLLYVEGISVPTESTNPIQCAALIKQPVNNLTSPYLVKLSVSQEGQGTVDWLYLYSGFPFYLCDHKNDFYSYPGKLFLFTDYLYYCEGCQTDDISEEMMKTDILGSIADDYKRRATVSNNTLSFSDGLDGDLTRYYQADLSEYRAEAKLIQESGDEKRKEDREWSETYQSIEESVEQKEELWWADPDQMIEHFVKTYLPTEGYESIREGNGKGEEPGFGTLTLVRKWDEESGEALYKTSRGTEISIQASHPIDPVTGEEYSFWFPSWAYGNFVTNQLPKDYVKCMRN